MYCGNFISINFVGRDQQTPKHQTPTSQQLGVNGHLERVAIAIAVADPQNRAVLETRDCGDLCPTPSAWGDTGKRPRALSWLWCVSAILCSLGVSSGVGSASCVCLLSASCFLGAVPVAVEASASSVLRSPQLSPQQCGAAHGPLHTTLCSSECFVGIWSRFFVAVSSGFV